MTHYQSKHKLKELFQLFLGQQELDNKKIIVSVSGGVDSMVLLHVAQQVVAPKNLAVFHVNHNTRSENKIEATFLERLCNQHNLTFLEYSIENQPHNNKENRWRAERKKLAQAAKQSFGAAILLTGHHGTDLVETMIFRLTKGSGVSGMSPFDTTTKPFWSIPKTQIVAYAKKNSLHWFDDSSNLDTKFHRNLIRQEILPVLRQITPNLEQVFVKESIIFGQIDAYLETETKKILHEYVVCPIKNNAEKNKPIATFKIPLTDFVTWPQIIQQSVLRKISGGTPSFDEIQDCLRWLYGKPQGNSHKKICATNLRIQHNNITN